MTVPSPLAVFALLCGLIVAGAGHAAFACGAVGGDPGACGGGQPAAQSTGLPATGAGNPIDLVTGNKYQREVDLAPLPGPLGLEFVRHYNSRSRYAGSLGYGWSHSYASELYRSSADVVQIRQADGRLIIFRKDRGERYRPPLPGDGWLEQTHGLYHWHWRNGRILAFDRRGRLLSILTPQGQAVFLTYGPRGRLIQISDPQRRRLGLDYDRHGRITRVTGPAGRQIHYHYDAWDNLTQVRYPDGTTRQYHYDDGYDAHNLTAITDRRGVTYARFAYDSQDRAVLSSHAGGVGKVTLAYRRHQTVLTNSQGQQTVYRTAVVHNLPLIESASGPGCATCPPGNVRYRYNSRPQLTAVTVNGRTIRYRYDRQGRLVRIGIAAQGRKAQLMVRYRYTGDGNRPTLIERPSVVAGKFAAIRIQYNTHRQPLQIGETGYAPDGTRIARTTQLRYDDRERLIAVDGPLPGAGDTTRYHYDPQGRLREIRHPGGLISRFAYDRAGRVRRYTPPDAVPIRYRYDLDGRLAALTRGGATTRLSYDGSGRLTAIRQPTGRRLMARYDAAGRLAYLIDGGGNQLAFGYDSASRLIAQALFRAGADGRVPAATVAQQQRRYAYDARGRLIAAGWGDQASVRYQRNAAGAVITAEHGHGAATHYRYDAWGRPVAVERLLPRRGTGEGGLIRAAYAPAPLRRLVTRFAYGVPGSRNGQAVSAVISADGHIFSRRFDDFGRVVQIHDDVRGTQTARYDAADRLIASRDAAGHVLRYRYDAAGRLRARIALRAGKEVILAHYGYTGAYLTAAVTAAATIRYRYDANGHLVRETHTRGAATFSYRYRYNRAGQKIEETLPDGQVVAYGYHQGHLSGIRVDGQPLVSQIAYYPFTDQPTAYRLGNQFVRWQPDAYGRLAQLQNGRLGSHRYHYDAAGRITRVSSRGISLARGLRAVAAPQAASDIRYRYDRQGRLRGQADDRPGGVTKTALAIPAGESIPEADPLPTGLPRRVAGKDYRYGPQHRLRAIAQQGRTLVRYAYDAFGARAAKTLARAPARDRLFVYHGYRLMLEADGRGRIRAQYLYLNRRPVAMLVGRRAFALFTDHRGAVTDAVDREGRIVWHARYSAWGRASVAALPLGAPGRLQRIGAELSRWWQALTRTGGRAPDAAIAPAAPLTLNLRLPGQYYDRESGLHYNLNRDYDPASGRYLEPDPLGYAGGADLYAYGQGDPINAIDPWGLAKLTYYLIDATPKTHSGSATRGRWAFWLRDIGGAGGDTNVLYDAGGDFFAKSSLYRKAALFTNAAADSPYAIWSASTMRTFAPPKSDFVRDFINHYLYDMISPPSFTTTISDQNATAMIADLSKYGDVQSKYWCHGGKAELMFPSIKLAHHGVLYPGGEKGKKDAPGGVRVPQGRDDILCKEAMTPNRRFDRLKAAIEKKETHRANCTTDGCPANTSNFLGESASHKPLQPASYGKTQFTAGTLVDEVLRSSSAAAPLPGSNSAKPLGALLNPRYSQSELVTLGLVDAKGHDKGLRAKLEAAKLRVGAVTKWKDFNISAATNITNIPLATLKQFAQDTGLGWASIHVSPPPVPDYSIAKDYYIRIVNYKKLINIADPYRKSSGGSAQKAWARIKANSADYTKITGLLTQLGMSETGLNPYLRVKMWEEGWQALRTAAVFSDPSLKTWMLGNADSVFKNQAKFDTISDLRMRRMIAIYHDAHSAEKEEDIVTRYANFHNNGQGSLTATPYSKSVVGYWRKAGCLTLQAARFSLNPKKIP